MNDVKLPGYKLEKRECYQQSYYFNIWIFGFDDI